MGLLDELAKEAAEAQERKREEVVRDENHIQRVEQLLRARLRATYGYFEKFHEHVDTLAPKLTTSYEVRGVGKLEGMVQGDYSLYKDDIPERMNRFVFKCVYKGEEEIQAEVRQAATTESVKEFLEKHRLQYKLITPANRPNQFSVKPIVTMSFEFSADVEQEMIRIDFRNVESLSHDIHRYDPAKLDRAFMDEIARCILHKPHKLSELTGNHLSDTTRLRFQEAVQESKRKKEEEEASARKRVEDGQAKKKARTSLGDKLGLAKLIRSKGS